MSSQSAVPDQQQQHTWGFVRIVIPWAAESRVSGGAQPPTVLSSLPGASGAHPRWRTSAVNCTNMLPATNMPPPKEKRKKTILGVEISNIPNLGPANEPL